MDRQSKKRQQILRGAATVFLLEGFEGASVDEIARAAGVSKATLYKYFPDKRELFITFVRDYCREQSQQLFQIEIGEKTLIATLTSIAQKYISFLVSEKAQGIRRTIIAESQRFEGLGLTFYQSGPAHGISRLSTLLTSDLVADELSIADAQFAAEQFLQLCRTEIFPQVLLGIISAPSPARINQLAEIAAQTFYRAYQKRHDEARTP